MKMLFDDAPVIVAAGMDFEARIAEGAGHSRLTDRTAKAMCGSLMRSHAREPEASSVSALRADFLQR